MSKDKINKDKFEWKSGDVQWSQCIYCSRLMEYEKCEAFPKGIPDKILDNKFDHRNKYRGDNGLTILIRPLMKKDYEKYIIPLFEKENKNEK